MFHINTDTLVYPPEIVRTNVVVEEVKAMMKRKKSMKIHIGTRFEVCRPLQFDPVTHELIIGPMSRVVKEVTEDGLEMEYEVKESDPYSMKTVSVQSHLN